MLVTRWISGAFDGVVDSFNCFPSWTHIQCPFSREDAP